MTARTAGVAEPCFVSIGVRTTSNMVFLARRLLRLSK